jgi:ATP-dependent DNA helicase RecG
MVYSFHEPATLVSDGTIQTKLGISEQTEDSSVHLNGSPVHLGDSSVHLDESSERLERLKIITEPIEGKRKVPASLMTDTILKLCKEDYLSLRDIATILHRTSDTLRIHYLNHMVKTGKLELRYPDKPSHPDQGYRTRRE